MTQAGPGTTILTGINTYTGTTTVQAGTLAVNGSITSPTSIGAQGILGGNGTIFGDVANAGTVAPGNSIGTLTVVGNYVGNNGRLALETVLAGDRAPSDVLVIDGGSATGATTIVVSNAGGLGAQTVADGIKVVNAVKGATTAAGAFALAGQFVTASGQQAVIGGAYGYTLHHGGVSAGSDVYGDTAFNDDWYLRSQLIGGPFRGRSTNRACRSTKPMGRHCSARWRCRRCRSVLATDTGAVKAMWRSSKATARVLPK